MNDGTYLEDTSGNAQTVTLGTTTTSDGIGAVQNNSMYRLFAYKDSSGDLAFILGYSSGSTLSAANPTTQLALTQINSQDISELFPIGCNICVWNTGSSYETPVFYKGGSYNSLKTNMRVTDHPSANTIEIAATLNITTFPIGATVYQVDNFQPIDCTTGSLHSNITDSTWSDMDLEIFTDGSGNIINFSIEKDVLLFDNGSGSTNYSRSTGRESFTYPSSYSELFISFCPPDKSAITCSTSSSVNTAELRMKRYYNTYGQAFTGADGLTAVTNTHNFMLHKILSVTRVTFAATGYIRGYKLNKEF